MQLTNILHRVPRWGWYGAGGIAFGGIALQLYRRREERTAALAGTNTAGTGGTQTPGAIGQNPSPAPGIVVPPVILPNQQSDPLAGVQPLQDLYIGAIGDIVSGWEGVASGWENVAQGWSNVYTPVLAHDVTLIDQLSGAFNNTNSALLALAQAGSVPPAPQAPSPVIAASVPAAPPALPAPAPAPTPTCPPGFPNGSPPNCYSNCAHDECHCEGTGANRKCWTRRDHGHCHSNGQRVHISYEFIRNGC